MDLSTQATLKINLSPLLYRWIINVILLQQLLISSAFQLGLGCFTYGVRGKKGIEGSKHKRKK